MPRGRSPANFGDTDILVKEAVSGNPVIGEIALEAKRIMEEDRWDVWGKSIAQLLASIYEDDFELIQRGADIMSKIVRDGANEDNS